MAESTDTPFEHAPASAAGAADEAAPSPESPDLPELPDARPVDADPALLARIAALESRVEDQDAALRRVLTLLVDWVEGERRPDLAAVRAATG